MVDDSNEFEAYRLTWAALLGQWVNFAQRTACLPNEGEAGLVRESTPDLIMLQAVMFALQNLEALEADQRALGIDRAEILIERHSQALNRRFDQTPMPEAIREMMDEAYAQLERVC